MYLLINYNFFSWWPTFGGSKTKINLQVMTWHTVRSAWETISNAKEIKPSSPMVFWMKTLMVNHLTVGKICHLISQPSFSLTCAFHNIVRTFIGYDMRRCFFCFKWKVPWVSSIIIHTYSGHISRWWFSW